MEPAGVREAGSETYWIRSKGLPEIKSKERRTSRPEFTIAFCTPAQRRQEHKIICCVPAAAGSAHNILSCVPVAAGPVYKML